MTDEELADDEDGYVCMTGEAFRNEIGGAVVPTAEGKVECVIRNMNKFRKIMPKLKVLARSQPDDKFLLVHGLIKEGKVVSVTGDGTNDAPALNRSDVGFAMGKTGTDVAKAASDIQLLDDNFCSILVAVKYGRNIYDNIRKFLQFQLTVNIVAMFIVFSGAIIFSDAPLTSVQMLWVNLIMDTFAALALATEPPNDKLLDRLPADRNEKIVNQVMWRNIVGQGIFQIGVLMCLLFFPMQLLGLQYDASMPFYPTSMDAKAWAELNGSTVAEYPYPLNEPTVKVEHYTFVFQTFVFMQLFN